MTEPLFTKLPYCWNSVRLFDGFAGQSWAVFLDSVYPHTETGRYDILAAEPMITLVTRGALTEVRTRKGRIALSPDDPFALLRGYLKPYVRNISGLPFCGGAIGYFSYDLGRRLERLPEQAANPEKLPEMAIGIYDWALVTDHHEQRSYLLGQGRDPDTRKIWQSLIKRFSTEAKREKIFSAEAKKEKIFSAEAKQAKKEKMFSVSDKKKYASAFHRIKEYIRAGDCYQVNLARCFTVKTERDPWDAYRTLRRMSPAPFAAYLNTPFARILSASPERFLRVKDGEAETKPIKGTRPRSPDPVRDKALADELCQSAKDRAENLMIVDLLRNDLGKNCAVGSIKAPKLFALESFAGVHHLVSTITGRLAPGRDALDLLRGCFPGGSITGAPKLRAMEIIEELEPERRGVYSGSIGYIGFDGNMDTNIAIRILVHSDHTMRLWSGGGIVADSDLAAEYRETFDKVAAMLALLQERLPLR
ncbi:MAG: aminodeoxychorismate synthase component I [Gammaproteobacteria bacterium]|nr:aminodeoxychorismate synthase component I [Gammaproteobacteria bacterium]